MTTFEKLAASAWLTLAALAGALSRGWLSLGTLEAAPLCLFKRATGLPCPGCGMGHALLHAFRGEWGASFDAHPYGLLLLAVWTAWLASRLLRLSWPRLDARPGIAALLAVWALRLF
jgi:hypothetical protein